MESFIGVLLRSRRLRELGIPAATIVMIAAWSFASPVFFRASNFENVSRQASVLSILAMGTTFVLVNGGIDFSIGATVAASGTVAAMTFQQTSSMLLAVLAAICIGAIVGSINGAIVVKLHISSFIATLGMLSVVRGAIMQITGGSPISALPEGFEKIGTGNFGPIPVPVIVVAILFILSRTVLESMHIGRNIRTVGSNARAAYLAGINTLWIRFLSFVLNGILAGLAGLLLASRVHSGQPTAAFGIELQAIAAAVLGGVSIYGGKGKLHGAVFGVLFLSFLTNGLNLLGVSTFIQETVIGAALIGAVWVDVVLVRRR
jgi:ribose transport system permease protein